MIGARLRELREGKELSQDALADLAGTRQCTISRLEAGLERPLLWTAWRIAQALGVTVNDLMEEE